ncbi:MAG: penicillin-binding protein 2 [Candidatus Berkelbacteria bacterium]|nr:penicillin-binding protein 2 [Candidatus Berkelbacteria bacterium]
MPEPHKKENIFSKFKPMGKIKDFLSERSYYDRDGSISGLQHRFFNWGSVMVAIFVVLIVTRLFTLQVQEGFINLKLAEGNRLKNIPVSAPRGIVLDDQGKLLASNDSTYELIIRLNMKKDLNSIEPQVFNTAGISKEDIEKEFDKGQNLFGYFILRENINRDDALLLKSRLPAYGPFEVMPTFIRKYATNNLSHVLGYLGKVSEDEGKDKPSLLVNGITGKSGLEKTYDEYLQGIPGFRRAEVDAQNRVVRLLSTQEPQAGNTLQSSIDLDLQNFASAKLEEKAKDLNTKGAIIVMDPRSGAVKAMVSFPYFDNTKMSTGITQEEYSKIADDPAHPLINRAISGVYPSGSSIKPFIATSALEFGIVDENLSFDTPPFIEIGQWKFPDWKDHGSTDIKRAIAESNNVFFYSLGGGFGPIKKGLGPDGMKKGLERFGFNSKTGIDLTGESEGFIPTPDWKKKKTGESWFIGNTYNMAIGQGDLLVTPIQIANATCAIANGGRVYKPNFVKKVVDYTGKTVKEFTDADNLVQKDIFGSHNLDIVRQGMRMTVTQGSAYSVFGNNFPLAVAAKTGTAQFGNEGKTHAWFSSFAPYDDPQLEVTVLIEGGGEGYQTAAPIAKDIYQWWADNRMK